jgi:hypothetical protein
MNPRTIKYINKKLQKDIDVLFKLFKHPETKFKDLKSAMRNKKLFLFYYRMWDVEKDRIIQLSNINFLFS